MNTATARRERGAALLVAMVMIFMLSIMGVSVMRTSSLEKRMATNAIQSSTALQAAESATELMLNDSDTLAAAAGRHQTIIDVDTTAVGTVAGVVDNSQIVYLRDGPAIGYSFDFRAVRFVAQGDTRIDAVRSRAIVRQGATRVVPALTLK